MHALRLALRALRAAPAVSLTVGVTLALGIGANTAIFSVINALMLRTLPVVEPGRLVTISSDFALARGFKSGAGWNHEMWTRLQRLPSLPFAGAILWSQPTVNLAAAGERQPARALLVSGSFFPVLGLRPHIGRLLTPADDARGGGRDGAVAVISHRLWRMRFDGSPQAVGSTLPIEGVPFTIVGVTAPEFLGLEAGQGFDVAIPLGTEPLIFPGRASIDQPRSFTFGVIVRLAPQHSLAQATAILQSIQPHVLGVTPERLADVSPGFLREPFVAVPAPTGTSDFSRLRTQYLGPLVALQILVALLLIMACLNVAVVLLARATARRYETAVRLALGATRRQLLPQLLMEHVLLAMAGATAGLPLAWWGSRALVSQLSHADAEVLLNLTPDWRVLLFTTAVALATAIVFGLSPVVRTAAAAPLAALRTQHHSDAVSPAGLRLTDVSIAAQLALSLVIIVAAGLLVRTFTRVATTPLGFEPERVLVATIDTAKAAIDPRARLSLYERLADGVRAVPNVAHASVSMDTPLSRVIPPPLMLQAQRLEVVVGPDWFATFGTPVVAGRAFNAGDTAQSPRVAVVNQAYARTFFVGDEALGQVVDGRTIVGVAADALFLTVRAGVRPLLFVPLAQSAGIGAPGRTAVSLSVRAAGVTAGSLTKSVATALTAIDPNLTFTFREMEHYVAASVAQERLVARLAGTFGGLALVLAGLGIYGVTTYAVTRRRHEIGIRMALGARPAHIVRLVTARTLAIAATGVALGLAAAIAGTHYLQALLFEITALDTATFAGVIVLLFLAGATAAAVPARRAAAIDPSTTLRSN